MRQGRERKDGLAVLMVLALVPVPFLTSLTGCSSPGGASKPRDVREVTAVKRPSSRGGRVSVAGNGLVFADSLAPGLSLEGLLTKHRTRRRQDRMRSARQLVRTWPDVALEVLRRFDYESGDRQAAASLAADYDCVTHSTNGWGRAVRALESGSLDGEAFFESLSELRAGLSRGDFIQVAESGSPALESSVPAALRAEALRLRALGALAANRLKEARRALDQALEAAHGQPHVAANLRLLRCETLRRLGREAAAERDWRQAVALAAAALTGSSADAGPRSDWCDRGLVDPGLWRLTMELRPRSEPGVERTPPVLRMLLAQPGGTLDSETTDSTRSRVAAKASQARETRGPRIELGLLELVAGLHLRRGEGRSALLAAKRAEALVDQRRADDAVTLRRLRLLQARALLLLGESGPAKTLLVDLARDRESLTGRRALLVLGALEIATGKARVGIGLLSSALAGAGLPRVDRARGKADLGLALLVVGREEPGNRHLDEAELGFRATGQSGELLQLLRNRLRYAEYRGDSGAAERLQSRIRALEQG